MSGSRMIGGVGRCGEFGNRGWCMSCLQFRACHSRRRCTLFCLQHDTYLHVLSWSTRGVLACRRPCSLSVQLSVFPHLTHPSFRASCIPVRPSILRGMRAHNSKVSLARAINGNALRVSSRVPPTECIVNVITNTTDTTCWRL